MPLSAKRNEPKMGTTASWRQHYFLARKNRWLGAFLSFIIPGAGSMYAGKLKTGFLLLILTILGYLAFILPGIFIHLIAVFYGYDHVRKFNVECLKKLKEREPGPGPL